MIPRTLLITGAAGFIGSHLVDRLLSQGHRVLGVDNMVLGRRENLAQAFKSEHFLFAELDINNDRAFLDFVTRHRSTAPVDAVWHMAANSDIPAGVSLPEVDLTRTFMTTFNVLKVMEALGIRQLCFASTSAIYGNQEKVLSEDTGPLFPISNYGAMKLGSEGMVSAALERFLERVWIFRFPNVVGGRATHGAIYDFIRKLTENRLELEVLGDGSQEKPYLHVSELIDAMMHLFAQQTAPLNYFNIAPDGSTTTVKYIAEAVVRALAPKAAIRYTGGPKGWVGDVPKFRSSIEKLKATGWHPRMTSNQAVDHAIGENIPARKQ